MQEKISYPKTQKKTQRLKLGYRFDQNDDRNAQRHTKYYITQKQKNKKGIVLRHVKSMKLKSKQFFYIYTHNTHTHRERQREGKR